VLLVSPTGSVHYRKRKIGIGIQWKGQRVTVIDSKPDHVVVLDRTTGAVLRELILGRSGPTTATAEGVTDLARTQKTAPPQVFLRTVSRAPRSRRSTVN